MVGSGARTSMDAVAWLPEPALEEVTVPVVFTLWPPVVPTTFTEKVQEPPAAMVPPDRLMTEKPETVPVVMVPAPQEPVSPLGVATARPPGSVSPNATPVKATVALGLVIVKLSVVWALLILKVSEVLALSRMLAAPNALVMVGAEATVRLALAVLPVPPLVEVTLPVVLVYCPEAAPVTVTENWHWLLVLMVAPDNA